MKTYFENILPELILEKRPAVLFMGIDSGSMAGMTACFFAMNSIRL